MKALDARFLILAFVLGSGLGHMDGLEVAGGVLRPATVRASAGLSARA